MTDTPISSAYNKICYSVLTTATLLLCVIIIDLHKFTIFKYSVEKCIVINDLQKKEKKDDRGKKNKIKFIRFNIIIQKLT